MTTPYIIASYPRSGSTWLRFILTNLMFPDKEHDFDSIHKTIPTIDHETELRESIHQPRFYKTHNLRNSANIILLYRHVADVLVSEFFYKKKYDPGDDRTFMEFLIADDFGSNWRRQIDHYFPSHLMISYEQLKEDNSVEFIDRLSLQDFSPEQLNVARAKSVFESLQRIESKGFGIHPPGNLKIKFFRSGTSGQIHEYGSEITTLIEKKNFFQLKQLGYL